MLCESCGKNEAYIHYTKIVNGKLEEGHLCEECAFKSYDFDGGFNMNKLFTGLIDELKDTKSQDREELKCSFCGLSYPSLGRKASLVVANAMKPLAIN